jgi:hypothetical protein
LAKGLANFLALAPFGCWWGIGIIAKPNGRLISCRSHNTN